MNTQNDVTQRRAQPGVALWRWVRALHAWIIGIGWTDLGTAFALIVVGNICLDDGHAWRGLWCWGLGLTIYFKAPRPNAADEGRAKRVPSGRLLDSEPLTPEQ